METQDKGATLARARAAVKAQQQPPAPTIEPPTATTESPQGQHPQGFDIAHLLTLGLPECIALPMAALHSERQRQVFLFSALALLSGILPQVEIEAGKRREGNLIAYLVGLAGGGKGIANVAWLLVEAIHKHRVAIWTAANETYTAEMAEYKATPAKDRGDAPTPPPYTCLHIPGNITKKAIILSLQNNAGRGILFETETDTLTKANRGEHGGFSDLLRQAAEHERISEMRAGDLKDGKGAIEIIRPCLSALLTSTPNQILALTPDIENGLFSRVCWYWLPATTLADVYDPAQYTTTQAESIAKQKGADLLYLYTYCLNRQTPLLVTLSPTQKSQLYIQLKANWAEADSIFNEAGNALAMRHYTATARLCIILQTLLTWQSTGRLPAQNLPCSDAAFALAKSMAATLWGQMLHTASKLLEAKNDLQRNSPNRKNPELEARILELKELGHNQAQIARALDVSEMTVHRYLKPKK
jgi:hypothetical protein